MTRQELPKKLEFILRSMGGKGTIVDVCKMFWKEFEHDIRNSGDLFYTWQYDIRWAATVLRQSNRMKPAEMCERGLWELI